MNWKKLKFFLPILTGLVLVFSAVLSTNFQAFANHNSSPSPSPSPFSITICHHTPGNDVELTFNNQQSYQGHLGQPHNNQTFDTNGPCPSPTPTPTPSPTPSPSTSPSPTPSASPAVGGGPGPSVGGNISTPQCPTDRPQQVDQVWFTDIKPGEVTVNWANKGDAWGFQIAYGPSQNNLIWGVEVNDPKATQFTLKSLPAGDLWVSIIAKSSKECGGPASEPKVVGQVLGPQVLGATGVASQSLTYLAGFALMTAGLWQAQNAQKRSAKRA